jgi:hypothetical protein
MASQKVAFLTCVEVFDRQDVRVVAHKIHAEAVGELQPALVEAVVERRAGEHWIDRVVACETRHF